jgi:hypothetical protein
VSCRDAAQWEAPGIAASFAATRVPIELGGEEAFPTPGGDLLRTGCPGPPQFEAIGLGSFASGSMPVAALARRGVQVGLNGAGRFRDGIYSGTRQARFTISLRRVRAHASYKLVREPR